MHTLSLRPHLHFCSYRGDGPLELMNIHIEGIHTLKEVNEFVLQIEY